MDLEYDEIPGPEGLVIRVPKNGPCRTCSRCGGDCEPDPTAGGDGIGARIAFVCPHA